MKTPTQNDTEAQQPASAGCHPTTCSPWSDVPETLKQWQDSVLMRPDPRAKRMVNHAVKLERERNALVEWAKWAAPILENAALIVIELAPHRLNEIAGCQACLERCPVDFESETNAAGYPPATETTTKTTK